MVMSPLQLSYFNLFPGNGVSRKFGKVLKDVPLGLEFQKELTVSDLYIQGITGYLL